MNDLPGLVDAGPVDEPRQSAVNEEAGIPFSQIVEAHDLSPS